MKPKILVLNFFPAFYPPSSGGELRYYHFYKELSSYFDITLLSPTYSSHKFEIVEHSLQLREYRIPKEYIHDRLHMQLDDEDIGKEISSLVCLMSAKYPNNYHNYFLELYQQTDMIIHESPYMLDYDIFFGLDDKPRIYNSYNHETVLVQQTWTGRKADKYIKIIDTMECKLVTGSDIVLAISEEEKSSFINSYSIPDSKIMLAPNGIIPGNLVRENKMNADVEKKTAFFIGSAHPPNLEAVSFIINNISEVCKNIEFIIAGSCCDAFKNIKKENVKFLGKIDDQTKHNLFSKVDLAINPMFSGAGTNLKTLEYLSAGIPLISTEFGVRGLSLKDGEHYIRAEKADFAQVLLENTKAKNLASLSNKAKEYINKTYSWEGIVNPLISSFNKLMDKSKKEKRKSIFLLNDFEVSSPSSGGEIRINKLYSNLSRNFNIIMLCLSNNDHIKLIKITDSFVQISIPKTNEHFSENERVSGAFWISTVDIISSYMIEKNFLLKRISQQLYKISDVVVLSHPYMVSLLDNLEGKKVIYESHNAEQSMKTKLLEGHPYYEELMKQVYNIEKKACDSSQFIISVSNEDHNNLLAITNDKSKKIFTIENGVEIKKSPVLHAVKRMFSNYPVIVFLGSAHQPNIEALNFIINNLAPNINAYFLIVGSVCDAIMNVDIPSNVLLFGKVDEDIKQVALNLADIAINPMLGGSGSNLKLADYFSHSLPTITTYFGARGYNIENEKHSLICEITSFKQQLELLIEDKKLQNEMGRNAYEFVVKHLDWNSLARKYNNIILREIFNSNKRRLLIITYRLTDPPLGGAETFLLNIIKQLDDLGDYSIDIATLNIHDIYNVYNFSTRFTNSTNKFPSNSSSYIHVHEFKVDDIEEQTKYGYSLELYKLWMQESIQLSTQFMGEYCNPILLGGWYSPEKVENQYEAWTSSEALIYVESVDSMEIQAFCPKRRQVTIYCDDKVIYQENIKGNVKIELPFIVGKVLKIQMVPFYVEGVDPRGLGLKVSSIKINTKNNKSIIRIDYDYRNYLKENKYEKYIEALIDNATNRKSNYDEMFQKVRGPVSSELESWLNNNIKDYDAILGHSIPFSTTVLASHYGKKFNKPVVLLPHFHIDDEFYHWNSYYYALKLADTVIAAPQNSVSLFYDKINVNSHALPGGAIDKKEYENIDCSYFNQTYKRKHPFFLVLGRKTAAKNYKWAIDAIQKVNENTKRCELVIIGKDEDQEEIKHDNVHYLGELDRKYVLGALKECIGLITMSESESFGIVILEAWMLKKPVIVNENCAAFVELVKDMHNGLLSNKYNLHDKINFVLDSFQTSKALGENGYLEIKEKYTWNSLGLEVNNLLNNL